MGRLIINGNQVYEIDEECLKKKECEERIRLEQSSNKEGERGRDKTDRRR